MEMCSVQSDQNTHTTVTAMISTGGTGGEMKSFLLGAGIKDLTVLVYFKALRRGL